MKMKDKDEDDKLFEGLYYHLGKLQAEKASAYLDQIEEAAHEMAYPEALEDWFNQYLGEQKAEERKIQHRKQWLKISKWVALFLVVATAGLGATTFSVEAFKIKLFNMVSEITSKYTEFEFVETDENSSDDVQITWSHYLYPDYLPKDFKLTKVQAFGNTRLLYFADPSGKTLEFSQSGDSSTFQVDTEQAETKKVEIADGEGWLIRKDGFSTLVWKRGELTLYLMGNLSDQELIKIAERLRLVEK